MKPDTYDQVIQRRKHVFSLKMGFVRRNRQYGFYDKYRVVSLDVGLVVAAVYECFMTSSMYIVASVMLSSVRERKNPK